MASTSVVFPLLAALQDEHHLPTAGIGVIAAGPFFAAVAVQLGLAHLADRGGARRLMVAGIVLASASLFGMAAGRSLWQFVLARSLAGLALGVFLPAARATAAGSVEGEHAHGLGRLSSAELAGLVAGPAVGAAIAAVAGVVTAFLAVGVAGLVVAVFIGRHLPNGVDGAEGSAPALLRPAGRGFAAFAGNRNAGAAILLIVAIEYPVGMFEATWARYLVDRGASSLFVGLSAATFGLPFILLAAGGGRVADRIGPARAAALASLVVAPIIAAYSVPHRPGLIVSLAVLEACFQAIAIPAARAAMVAASPPDGVAAGQGLAGAVGLFATGVAALVTPAVYTAGGAVAMCTSVAAVVVVMVIGALMLGPSVRPAARPVAEMNT
ncbi:MAG: major facilitator superfamily 1 [Actinomycetia bacterium]|nr:major facilitator superfamily 1 [Actinomycetes bacterium]